MIIKTPTTEAEPVIKTTEAEPVIKTEATVHSNVNSIPGHETWEDTAIRTVFIHVGWDTTVNHAT